MAVTTTTQKTYQKILLENQLVKCHLSISDNSPLSAIFWVTHRTAHAFSCIQSASTKVPTTTSPLIFAKGSQILEKKISRKKWWEKYKCLSDMFCIAVHSGAGIMHPKKAIKYRTLGRLRIFRMKFYLKKSFFFIIF